jgi:hypothetical protein
MQKLRSTFWTKTKNIIEWCGDEELRVLRTMAGKELETRLAEITSKFNQSEESRKQQGRQSIRKRARGL